MRYFVDRQEEDGVEFFEVFRFGVHVESLKATTEKIVLDSFPEKEDAAGVAEYLNRRWEEVFRYALVGSASNGGAREAQRMVSNAYHIACEAVERT